VWVDLSTGQAPPADPAARTHVVFGSDDYFALLDAHPEIGRYLAVATHLLLNVAGTWYEIADQ
jgi:hypothetical protein